MKNLQVFSLSLLVFCSCTSRNTENEKPVMSGTDKQRIEKRINQATEIQMKLELSNNYDTIPINKAIDLYSDCIRIDPSNKIAYTQKSILLSKKGRYDEAISTLNSLVEIYPDFAEAYTTIGFITEVQGNDVLAHKNYAKAINLYSAKISTYPEKASQYMQNIVLMYLMKGQKDSANTTLKRFPRNDSISIFAYEQTLNVFENFDKEEFLKNYKKK